MRVNHSGVALRWQLCPAYPIINVSRFEDAYFCMLKEHKNFSKEAYVLSGNYIVAGYLWQGLEVERNISKLRRLSTLLLVEMKVRWKWVTVLISECTIWCIWQVIYALLTIFNVLPMRSCGVMGLHSMGVHDFRLILLPEVHFCNVSIVYGLARIFLLCFERSKCLNLTYAIS